MYLLSFFLSSLLISCCLSSDPSSIAGSIDDISTNDERCEQLLHENSIVTAVGQAMRLGLWSCAKKIVASKEGDGVNFRSLFDLEQRSIMKEISLLKTTIESNLPMSNVAPAFQWAQSANEVLLNVKFSHKIDAPATLNVEPNNITILENRLILRASDGRKNFNLDLELLRSINPVESRYEMASGGRMTFSLKKNETSQWSRLLKSKDKKISNMHFWWEMQEKYSDELEELSRKTARKKKLEASNEPSKISESEQERSSTIKTGEEVSNTEAKPVPPIKSPALIEELKRVDKDAEKRMLAIDMEAKKKKSAIDVKAKQEKKDIDATSFAQKQEIEKEAEAEKSKLEESFKLESTEVSEKLPHSKDDEL
jgi:hypothetical protein